MTDEQLVKETKAAWEHLQIFAGSLRARGFSVEFVLHHDYGMTNKHPFDTPKLEITKVY